MDNDAYMAWSGKREWDSAAWTAMLKRARMTGRPPMWVLVPDVVADRQATLDSWNQFAPEAKSYGWPLAFAVQNGMTADDVPPNAEVVFIGGTTDWKWRNLPMWARLFPRVHVGRVNEVRRLWTCEEHGVESVDGTGWFRGTDEGRQARGLLRWLAGERNETPELAPASAG